MMNIYKLLQKIFFLRNLKCSEKEMAEGQNRKLITEGKILHI